MIHAPDIRKTLQELKAEFNAVPARSGSISPMHLSPTAKKLLKNYWGSGNVINAKK